jgi:DNA-binding transcriptional LysR family regulator
MDLKRLRTFITVAESGSVSKAAVRLHVAQPALSRQIINLEMELGLKLFDRVGRGLVLTREGEQLVESSRSVLSQVAFLAERARVLREGEASQLKIAASPQIIEGVLSRLLPRFRRSHPRVEIRLTEAVGRAQLNLLERGEADVSVGLLGAIQNESRFAFQALPAVEILAAAQRSSKLGRRGVIDIVELAKYPLLVLDPTYVFRKSFDAACRLGGVEVNIVMESRAPHTLLALAEAGQGVAIIQTAVPVERYALQISRVTCRRKPIRIPMAAIWDKRRTLPRHAMMFCQLLANEMRSVFPIARAS